MSRCICKMKQGTKVSLMGSGGASWRSAEDFEILKSNSCEVRSFGHKSGHCSLLTDVFCSLFSPVSLSTKGELLEVLDAESNYR